MVSPSSSETAIAQGLRNPQLMQAALALYDDRLADAEPLLRAHLKSDPFDVAAIRMMSELAARVGRYRDAENLLRRALELAPEFGAARANLATILYRQNRPLEALAELDTLAAKDDGNGDPDNLGHNNLRAATLGRIGEFEEALRLYEAVLAQVPNQPRVWLSYGHMLKTVGRVDDGIAAYRRTLQLSPHMGEAWWSLANLKTVRFTVEDVAAMQAALTTPNVNDEDRFHLDFALGKAFEDMKMLEPAFRHYAAGNALRRRSLPYDAAETTAMVDDSIAQYTADFFAERQGSGCDARDPIFVLGMPRAGSTLVEQILSSHSSIEGTSELADIPLLARRFSSPERLAELTPEQLKALGEEYLKRTQVQRKSGRPLFIDKLPNNWAHVPFIHLILPNATIIDARRHPMSCCFSNFKQHFARGQGFTYSLDDLGRYYSDYVRLMDHVDRVMPGRVHRVIYERMVDATEAEIRALVAACGLDFEDTCLRFHETERAVRTPSSEQVRQPIFRGGTEAWQGFAPWLRPLEQGLGPVLAAYPDAPAAF